MFLYISTMKRYRQYKPVVISAIEAVQWHHPIHRHTHYEIIYIQSGKGIHHIQGVTYSYSEGSVFLLGPEDDHFFEIKEQTRFIYIKFTDPYVYANNALSSDSIRHLEYLIKSRETHSYAYIISSQDQKVVAAIFDLIIALHADLMQNEVLIWMQVLALATVLQRNMPTLRTTGKINKDMQAVFCYIHKHIYEPEKLRAVRMATEFNTTANYIGPYFKKNVGVTLSNYISAYRKALINQRLASKRYSLKEIAATFGLTDESHVMKIIKKNNVTPDAIGEPFEETIY